MITDELIQRFRDDRDHHYEQAKEAIQRVVEDLEGIRHGLADPAVPLLRTPGAGSVLDCEAWQDAERALVRFWDAAAVVALLEFAPGARGRLVVGTTSH